MPKNALFSGETNMGGQTECSNSPGKELAGHTVQAVENRLQNLDSHIHQVAERI